MLGQLQTRHRQRWVSLLSSFFAIVMVIVICIIHQYQHSWSPPTQLSSILVARPDNTYQIHKLHICICIYMNICVYKSCSYSCMERRISHYDYVSLDVNRFTLMCQFYPRSFKIAVYLCFLHPLIGSFSHCSQGFIHPRWCRISSINNIIRIYT